MHGAHAGAPLPDKRFRLLFRLLHSFCPVNALRGFRVTPHLYKQFVLMQNSYFAGQNGEAKRQGSVCTAWAVVERMPGETPCKKGLLGNS
jgi:hypothetical protein